MKKWTPVEKRTKKEKKAYYAKERGSWGVISPVSRTVPSMKAYDRNRQKKRDRRDESSCDLFFYRSSWKEASLWYFRYRQSSTAAVSGSGA